MRRSVQGEVVKHLRMETVNLAQQSAVSQAAKLARHHPQSSTEQTWSCRLL